MLHSDKLLQTDKPLQQVDPAEAWVSALSWWARSYPGRPVDMSALIRRSRMARSTAYDYLREYRRHGLVDANNVPISTQGRMPPSNP